MYTSHNQRPHPPYPTEQKRTPFTLTRCNSIDFPSFFIAFREAARFSGDFSMSSKRQPKIKKREKTTVLVPVTCQFIFADKLLQAKCKKWDTTSFCFEQKTEEAESFVLSNKGSYNFYLRISDKCTKLKNKTSMRCPPCLFEKCNQKPKKKTLRKPKLRTAGDLESRDTSGEARDLTPAGEPNPLFHLGVSLSLYLFLSSRVCIFPRVCIISIYFSLPEP